MLRECSPPQTCHVLRVMCHVLGQNVEGFWWRVCYQRGLPRLVFFVVIILLEGS